MNHKTIYQHDGILVDSDDIRFLDTPDALTDPTLRDTIRNFYLLSGHFAFTFNGVRHHVAAPEGVLLTAGQLITDVVTSPDLDLRCTAYGGRFMQTVMPTSHHGTQMLLSQLQDPVLHMTQDEADLALSVARAVKQRFSMTGHRFFFENLKLAVQTGILDHYDVMARNLERISAKPGVGQQTFHRFVTMLDAGDFRQHRDVAYYADRLHITPKYLSELCTRASGRTATYWIEFFTDIDIASQLQEGTLTIQEICDRLNFSSLSYFSHYVKAHFKFSPQEYRRRAVTGNAAWKE